MAEVRGLRRDKRRDRDQGSTFGTLAGHLKAKGVCCGMGGLEHGDQLPGASGPLAGKGWAKGRKEPPYKFFPKRALQTLGV